MNKIGMTVSAVALCCASAASALPASVSWTYVGISLGGGARYGFNQNTAWNNSNPSQVPLYNHNIGFRQFTWGSGTVETFSAQQFENVTVGSTYTYDVRTPAQVPDAPPSPGPMGAVKSALMQDLYVRFYDSVDTADEAIAFQLAVYEISQENLNGQMGHPGFASAAAVVAAGALDLSIGAYRASNAGAYASAYAIAAGYLSGVGGNSGTDFRTSSSLFGMTNTGAQDQLLMVPIGAPGVIAGLGLVGVVALRRRRK